MSQMSSSKLLFGPIFENNPLTLQVLGICSALAVTSSLKVTLVMAISVTLVTAFSSFFVSVIRKVIPYSIRIIIQMTIIASFVIVIDQLLRAYAPEISDRLSVFVGLIITNCIVMGRAEAFAMGNPPVASFLDGFGTALGYSFILVVIAIPREFLGSGSLLGYQILTPEAAGGLYEPNALMLLSPSGFFLIGSVVWVYRTIQLKQVEPLELSVKPHFNPDEPRLQIGELKL